MFQRRQAKPPTETRRKGCGNNSKTRLQRYYESVQCLAKRGHKKMAVVRIGTPGSLHPALTHDRPDLLFHHGSYVSRERHVCAELLTLEESPNSDPAVSRSAQYWRRKPASLFTSQCGCDYGLNRGFVFLEDSTLPSVQAARF